MSLTRVPQKGSGEFRVNVRRSGEVTRSPLTLLLGGFRQPLAGLLSAAVGFRELASPYPDARELGTSLKTYLVNVR